MKLKEKYDKIEKETHEKAQQMQKKINEMKDKFAKIKNKERIFIDGFGEYFREVVDGKWIGLGQLRMEDGNKYIGEFFEDGFHGIWLLMNKDEDYFYLGEFKGTMMGFGILENGSDF